MPQIAYKASNLFKRITPTFIIVYGNIIPGEVVTYLGGRVIIPFVEMVLVHYLRHDQNPPFMADIYHPKCYEWSN